MQTIFQNTLADTMYDGGVPILTYQIDYPSFETTCIKEAAERINAVYEREARAAEEYCRTILFERAKEQAGVIPPDQTSFLGYEWIITYQVTYNEGCVTSLYADHYSYMGGAHGSTLRTSDTWNFRTGERIMLSECFCLSDFDLLLRKELFQIIEEQIAGRLRTTPGSFFDDYPALLREHFHAENFYLVPEGLKIYYQQYDIAPYASGIPEFLISSRMIKSIQRSCVEKRSRALAGRAANGKRAERD